MVSQNLLCLLYYRQGGIGTGSGKSGDRRIDREAGLSSVLSPEPDDVFSFLMV
jgi:hypothetical protein